MINKIKRYGGMNKRMMLTTFVFTFVAAQAVAQGKSHSFTLTGTVINTMEEPVRNAILFVDGIQTNKESNRKGKYKIRINEEINTISVYSSFFGSEDMAYNGQESIDFVLTGAFNSQVSPEQKTKEMVNIGYGQVQREKVSTSVGSLNEDGKQKRIYSNIYSMIQAKVPGIQVSGERIIIRGIHTNSDNSTPVFVVDGVTVKSISNINPVEVESIDILKGAAGSIYGFNGANGVILIKLKK